METVAARRIRVCQRFKVVVVGQQKCVKVKYRELTDEEGVSLKVCLFFWCRTRSIDQYRELSSFLLSVE